MICVMALPVLAASLCVDGEPGAPWVRLPVADRATVYLDPTSVRGSDTNKRVRLLSPAGTPSAGDVLIDLSINCPAREAVIIRLTDAKSGKANDIAPADRKPADPGDPIMARLVAFVCEGTPL